MANDEKDHPDAALIALIEFHNAEMKAARDQNDDPEGHDPFGDAEGEANQHITDAEIALGRGETVLAESLLRKAITLIDELEGDFSTTSAFDHACDALDYLEEGDLEAAKEAMPSSEFRIIRHYPAPKGLSN